MTFCADFCRNIIYLIAEYLKEAGLNKTHAALIDESQLSNEFAICDNVDLETIYLEFCSYYHVKFGKKPRFVKRNEQQQQQQTVNGLKNTQISSSSSSSSSHNPVDTQTARQILAKKRTSLKTASHAATTMSTIFPESEIRIIRDLETSQCLQVASLSPTSIYESNEKISIISTGIFRKSMHDFYNSHPHDWKDISELIIRDVIRKNLCVKWDDIVGLDDAKMILRESVIFPMKYPQLFNRLQAWKG